MDLSPDQFPEATRKDGWSPELKARFLSLLAEAGNVRLAARRCGMSAQSAYVQRRRDPLFARAWAAATMLAAEHAEQVLADRAIEGIEEDIWYRGELVGTRRRYDSRLLLAHLARLDRQIEAGDASEDAGRFDELVALVAGAEVPEALDLLDDDGLPAARADHVERVVRDAIEAFEGDARENPEAWDAALATAGDTAGIAAQAEWCDWHDIACDTVDRIVADPPMRDRVNPSTSVAENAQGGEGSPRDGADLIAARTRIVTALAAFGTLARDGVNPSTSTDPNPSRGGF